MSRILNLAELDQSDKNAKKQTPTKLYRIRFLSSGLQKSLPASPMFQLCKQAT